MLDIKSILTHMFNCISKKDPRFIIDDDEHVTDTKTGITLHVYDSWFKITYDDDNVIVKDDFTDEEQNIIWRIKQAITPPDVLKQREDNYKPLQIARRKKFSELYESPTPLTNTPPTAEAGATPYRG